MPNVKPEDVRAYIISLIGKYEKHNRRSRKEKFS